MFVMWPLRRVRDAVGSKIADLGKAESAPVRGVGLRTLSSQTRPNANSGRKDCVLLYGSLELEKPRMTTSSGRGCSVAGSRPETKIAPLKSSIRSSAKAYFEDAYVLRASM